MLAIIIMAETQVENSFIVVRLYFPRIVTYFFGKGGFNFFFYSYQFLSTNVINSLIKFEILNDHEIISDISILLTIPEDQTH